MIGWETNSPIGFRQWPCSIKEELALAREERDELKMLLVNLHVKIPDVIK